MSIFGIRNKAKGFLKNVLGLEEAHETPEPHVSIVKEEPIIEKEILSKKLSEQKSEEEKVEVVAEEPVIPETSAVSEVPEGGLELTMENVQEVFDDYVRPGLQSDGGDITLLKIEENDIYVRLVGACSTCPSSVMTMKMGVEALLQEEFPTMRELIDVTSQETEA
jgi:NFU1 iron-sulfur cluster scaffold homolog, mitochondrial